MSENNNTKHMTAEQKKQLVDIMSTKNELRSGKFSDRFTKKTAQKEWEDIAIILNALPGANKPWQSWRKSWQDLLSKTKSRKGAYNSSLNRTGGGPSEASPLNEVEERVAAMIDPRAISGHMESEESQAVFNFNNDGASDSQSQIGLEADDNQVVVVQIVSDDATAPQYNRRPQKKINIKSLMQNKLEVKKTLCEAKIKFYQSYIVNMEKQTAALEQIALALQGQNS